MHRVVQHNVEDKTVTDAVRHRRSDNRCVRVSCRWHEEELRRCWRQRVPRSEASVGRIFWNIFIKKTHGFSECTFGQFVDAYLSTNNTSRLSIFPMCWQLQRLSYLSPLRDNHVWTSQYTRLQSLILKMKVKVVDDLTENCLANVHGSTCIRVKTFAHLDPPFVRNA